MPFKFFTIPVMHGEAAEKSLNDFLAAHQTMRVEERFIEDGAQSFWTVAVTYAAGRNRAVMEAPAAASRREVPADYKPKVDYEEILEAEQFVIYEQLRDKRNRMAEELKIPAYNIFNNAQLAAMVTDRPETVADLLEMDGVGEKKADNYGETFLEMLREIEAGSNGSREPEGPPQ